MSTQIRYTAQPKGRHPEGTEQLMVDSIFHGVQTPVFATRSLLEERLAEQGLTDSFEVLRITVEVAGTVQ